MSIKSFRESSGMTQVELSCALGVSRSAVAAWENGVSNPRFDSIQRMTQIFNCSIDELMKKEDK